MPAGCYFTRDEPLPIDTEDFLLFLMWFILSSEIVTVVNIIPQLEKKVAATSL
jgi:hypothetical protein